MEGWVDIEYKIGRKGKEGKGGTGLCNWLGHLSTPQILLQIVSNLIFRRPHSQITSSMSADDSCHRPWLRHVLAMPLSMAMMIFVKDTVHPVLDNESSTMDNDNSFTINDDSRYRHWWLRLLCRWRLAQDGGWQRVWRHGVICPSPPRQ